MSCAVYEAHELNLNAFIKILPQGRMKLRQRPQ